MAKRVLVLMAALAAMLAAAVPAFAQEQYTGETVPVTFELTIDGEVPEGYSFFLNFFPPAAPDARVMDEGFFCTTTPEKVGPAMPLCEEGKTYSANLEVIAGEPFPYEYMVGNDYGDCFGNLSTNNRTFTEESIVSVTYAGPEDLCRESVPVNFELAVEGEPPAEAVFFGLLRDQDGETTRVPIGNFGARGFYAGGYGVPLGDSFEAQIIQSTQDPNGPSQVIKDFGTVTIEEETTLKASVSFEDGSVGGSDNNDGSGGSGNGGSANSSSGNSGSGVSGKNGGSSSGGGSSGSGSDGSGGGDLAAPENGVDLNEDGSTDEADGQVAAATSDDAMKARQSSGGRALPATGGVALPIAGVAGALLVGGGLLIRRLSRQRQRSTKLGRGPGCKKRAGVSSYTPRCRASEKPSKSLLALYPPTSRERPFKKNRE